jgi:hypothetical protein
MILNPQIEQLSVSKLGYLMDSEAVAKDKRFKLGVWLHEEHKRKFKRTASPAETNLIQKTSQDDAEKTTVTAPKAAKASGVAKNPLTASKRHTAPAKTVIHRPYFPIKTPVYSLLAAG